MSGALVAWPARAAFGQTVPKKKVIDATNPAAALRQKITDQVAAIRWEFKLSPETTVISATADVPEIQVIRVHAKAADVDNAVIALIDRAIQTPVLFEVEAERPAEGHAIRMVATEAMTGRRGASPSDYVTTEWMRRDAERSPLPPAVDLAGLYAALVRGMIPVATSPEEPVGVALKRTREVGRVEREIERLTKRMRAEKQFNREVELLQQIRELKTQLDDLLSGTSTSSEDSTWTN